MAYVLSSLSPEQLIALEARHFLIANNDKFIFGYNTHGQLIPEQSINFYTKVNDAIQMTNAFLETIKIKNLLQQTGTIKIYVQVVSNEINHIEQEITQLKTLLGAVDTSSSEVRRPAACLRDPEILLKAQADCTEIDRDGSRGQAAGRRESNDQLPLVKAEHQSLDDVLNALDTFKKALSIIKPMPSIESRPITSSKPRTEPPEIVIPELENFITQHGSNRYSFLNLKPHKHTDAEKLKAAKLLQTALKTGRVNNLDITNEIYKTNPHLSKIIKDHELAFKFEARSSQTP